MKPATAACRGDRIVRSEGALSAPPNDLIAYDFERPPADAYLIGAVGGGLTPDRYVAAPLVDSFFSYSPGKSRWGKSEANLVRFAELARANRCSTLFLDPTPTHWLALSRTWRKWVARIGSSNFPLPLAKLMSFRPEALAALSRHGLLTTRQIRTIVTARTGNDIHAGSAFVFDCPNPQARIQRLAAWAGSDPRLHWGRLQTAAISIATVGEAIQIPGCDSRRWLALNPRGSGQPDRSPSPRDH